MRTLLYAMLAAVIASEGVGGRQNAVAEKHVAAARAAAGAEFAALFDRLCSVAAATPSPVTAAPGPVRPAVPARAQWYAEPAKVFDNLYFVGTREHSAWAVVTSGGIIIIDPLYAYAVEDEVVGGLRKVGLDPANIKFVIVSHGHSDHSGGAGYLQDKFKARVILAAADWDLLERNTRDAAKPRRDMVASDGQKLTLGDTTLTLYLTPGHTAGTISTLIPVRDGDRRHVAAIWGGTAFNFRHTPEAFHTYVTSAERFKKITADAGADVLLSNHVNFDGSNVKLPALAKRGGADPHPYVVGNEGIQRYLIVAAECAKAGAARLLPQ